MKPNKTIKLTALPLYSILYTLYFALAPRAHAQGFDLSTAFKLNETSTVQSKFNSITDIFSIILPNVYILSGIILFFILLGAGFTLVTSSSNPEAQQKGKQALMGAIIGFIVIFSSYWIIQILEILTGIQILNASITP